MRKLIIGTFFLLFAFSLQAEKPWKAVWISHQGSQSVPNEWICFRKAVDVAEVPAEAVARIAADSKYWLWINGEPVVFEGGLKRGPEPGATYYDEVDIAPYLKPGTNTVAALVWFFGKNGFSHASSGSTGFLFDCQAPGVEILTDRTWNNIPYQAYQDTDEPHPNYRLSESNIRFDARLAIADWQTATELRSNCMFTADPGKAPYGKLVKRPIPMWKDYGLKNYEEVTRVGDTLFCKLPYNAQVTPWFKVRASRAGQTIGILTDDYRTGYSEAVSVRAEYITRQGEQEYESLGWMNGHVVKYAIPRGVEVLEVKYRETGYDTEFAGSFICDDPFYNELWKRAARTLYVNMRDTYFDCPERERAQWWGDVVNELGQTFYAFDPKSYRLTRKGILELMKWQRADGVIYSPVPAGNWTNELPLQMLASVGWYGFYTHYYYSGDETFVPEIYNALARYLHHVWKLDADGLVVFREGDWSWGDTFGAQDMEVCTNAWYYMALKTEREFARILGRTGDVANITSIMTRMERAFNEKFWTGTAYRHPDFTDPDDDRAQALAVLAGLAGEDKYPAITKILETSYIAAPFMERFVLEALFVMNEPEIALKRMKDRFSSMLAYDYTTLFEVWTYMDTPTNGNSYNHAWSGSPLIMLSQYVCGIQPTSPGFRTFRIAPQMGMLREASAVASTTAGEIRVSVSRRGRGLIVTATVPEGATGEVCFPSGQTVPLTAGTQTVRGR